MRLVPFWVYHLTVTAKADAIVSQSELVLPPSHGVYSMNVRLYLPLSLLLLLWTAFPVQAADQSVAYSTPLLALSATRGAVNIVALLLVLLMYVPTAAAMWVIFA